MQDPIFDLTPGLGHEANRRLRAGYAARAKTNTHTQQYTLRTMGHSWLGRTSFLRLPDVSCCDI